MILYLDDPLTLFRLISLSSSGVGAIAHTQLSNIIINNKSVIFISYKMPFTARGVAIMKKKSSPHNRP